MDDRPTGAGVAILDQGTYLEGAQLQRSDCLCDLRRLRQVVDESVRCKGEDDLGSRQLGEDAGDERQFDLGVSGLVQQKYASRSGFFGFSLNRLKNIEFVRISPRSGTS